MTDGAKDLAALLPGRDVQCKGESIRVLPLFFGQYPKAVKLVRPLATVLQESGAFSMRPVTDDAGKTQMQFGIAENWLGSLPDVLEKGGEALIQFFAYAIGKPRDWFDTLPGDEGFALAEAILKENADFFVQRIMPLLTASGLLTASTGPDGGPSLQGSTATDIPGTAFSG
jgi:hypothetical protein